MHASNRQEELLALDCILTYLQSQKNPPPKITREPNGVATAPDFLLNFEKDEINLEVTISGDGFILTNENPTEPKSRETYERSTYNMLKKLENLIASWIKPAETITLMILSHLPVKNRGQLAKKISNALQREYSNGQLLLGHRRKINIPTSCIVVPQIKLEAMLANSYPGKKTRCLEEILTGSLESPSPIAQNSLSLQAEYILFNRITEKEKNLSSIEGKKWLAILNTNILLCHLTYKTAFSTLKEKTMPIHNFEKIFLIDKKTVVEL